MRLLCSIYHFLRIIRLNISDTGGKIDFLTQFVIQGIFGLFLAGDTVFVVAPRPLNCPVGTVTRLFFSLTEVATTFAEHAGFDRHSAPWRVVVHL